MDNSYDYATIIDTSLRCSVFNNVYNKLCQHILGNFVSIIRHGRFLASVEYLKEKVKAPKLIARSP